MKKSFRNYFFSYFPENYSRRVRKSTNKKFWPNGHMKLLVFSSNVLPCILDNTWVKVFRINPEFRILRLTFQRKSASKC